MSKTSIIDFISYLTVEKKPWSSLSESDKKAFSPFIVSLWLSMSTDYLEIVNQLQKYTIGLLKPEHVYRLYLDLLPKRKIYFKYVKGKIEDKYNKEMLELFVDHYKISKSEAIEYIELLRQHNPKQVEEIIKLYGKSDKEIEKMLKK
jgi:hypothetical protein